MMAALLSQKSRAEAFSDQGLRGSLAVAPNKIAVRYATAKLANRYAWNALQKLDLVYVIFRWEIY